MPSQLPTNSSSNKKKIVLNASYGGFSLSKTVKKQYRAVNGIVSKADERWKFTHKVERDDPSLIQIIESVGLDKAAGARMTLRIAEIPDDVSSWSIVEYDGVEWVAEKHETFDDPPNDSSRPHKVVINVKYGRGFSLSKIVKQMYFEAILPEKKKSSDWNIDNDVERDDPVLIGIIESVGLDKASEGGGTHHHHAKLEIVGVPTDIDWEITEYDGAETCVERHRVW